jgi:hypothetical protein
LIELMTNLDRSLSQFSRTVYVVYHNPLLEHVLADHLAFNKIGGTHQYSIFRSGGSKDSREPLGNPSHVG